MEHKNHFRAPIIGISASILTIETGSFMGRERTFVGHDYIQAIEQAGGIPLVLPIVETKGHIERQVELIDALVLSGGYDVDPFRYGEEPEQGLEKVCPERDIYEIELVKMVHRLEKPILGICRGLQLLNIIFGGTLYQDIPRSLPNALEHNQRANPEIGSHTIELVEGTFLKQLMNKETLLTNSFHHQSIKNLAPGFIVNAYARDGVIEGIEKVEGPFVLGVQWHPELMFIKDLEMQKLFQSFVQASLRHKV